MYKCTLSAQLSGFLVKSSQNWLNLLWILWYLFLVDCLIPPWPTSLSKAISNQSVDIDELLLGCPSCLDLTVVFFTKRPMSKSSLVVGFLLLRWSIIKKQLGDYPTRLLGWARFQQVVIEAAHSDLVGPGRKIYSFLSWTMHQQDHCL